MLSIYQASDTQFIQRLRLQKSHREILNEIWNVDTSKEARTLNKLSDQIYPKI